MKRTTVKAAAMRMKDIKDLRSLLNEVKRDALGKKSYPFHLKQITYYCNPKREGIVRYIDFPIPKKSGGERTISAPVPGLKSILTSLNVILQSIYEPSKYAMGFVPGRSVVDNAKQHIGQNYVYNIDLEDFFPSIDKSRIWKRLTLKPFGFSSELADVIAGLCTMRYKKEGKEVRYVLPQGAPTSPTITNIICDKLDRKLGGLAKRFGAKYSRYADDITFSSMHYIYAADGEFIAELHKIIADNHFVINDKKTRLQKVGERQEVTGLILSEKVNVVNSYIRELRTLIHIWEKYGYPAACESYMRARKANPKKRYKGGMPILDKVLMGKLQYLKMVKGIEDSTYKSLYKRFINLKGGASKALKYIDDKKSKIKYLHSMSREEFENALSVSIMYRPKAAPNLYFIKDKAERAITISKNVDVVKLFGSETDNSSLWKKFQISLCDNGTTPFYLLHKKLVSPKYTTGAKVLTAELQNELSELINSEMFLSVMDEISVTDIPNINEADDKNDDNINTSIGIDKSELQNLNYEISVFDKNPINDGDSKIIATFKIDDI